MITKHLILPGTGKAHGKSQQEKQKGHMVWAELLLSATPFRAAEDLKPCSLIDTEEAKGSAKSKCHIPINLRDAWEEPDTAREQTGGHDSEPSEKRLFQERLL